MRFYATGQKVPDTQNGITNNTKITVGQESSNSPEKGSFESFLKRSGRRAVAYSNWKGVPSARATAVNALSCSVSHMF